MAVFECNTCNISSCYLYICLLQQRKNNSSYVICKKMWYLLKISLALKKKGAALFKIAKVVKSLKGPPRNGCDGGKNFNSTHFRSICVASSQESAQNLPELLLLKFLPSTYTITAISLLPLWLAISLLPLWFHNFFYTGHF